MNGIKKVLSKVVVMCLVFALAFSVAPMAMAKKTKSSIKITNKKEVSKLYVCQSKKIKVSGVKG
ncbi:MAG: hypothetical protein K5639_07955, partial [Eubacterium sp.]|nr:hypothetical protein [Eubacterium sp.]